MLRLAVAISEPPVSSSARALRPHQRVAVVVNGNARSVTDEVISSLHQILKGGDLFVSRHLKDAPDIAKTIVSHRYGTVLTGGGDGTFTVMVTEVIRECRKQHSPLPRFGLLKLGTGNALAWVVGAGPVKGRRELAADIHRLQTDAGSRPIRLIEVEGHIAPFCGLGADAEVLRDYNQVKRRLQVSPLRRVASGPLSYTVAAITKSLPGYLLGKMPHCTIVNDGEDAYRVAGKGKVLGPPIRAGEVLYEGPMRLAAVSTIPYYGFGFRIFPYAEERLDRMHLRVATLSSVSFLRHFRAIWKGDFEDSDLVFDFLVQAITIQVDPKTALQIGGDPQGLRDHVRAALTPETIRLVDFYAPPSAS